MRQIIVITSIALLCWSCGGKGSSKAEPKSPTKKESVQDLSTVEFNADSAFVYIEQQLAFGPRVPNTNAHEACGNWLVTKLNSFGAEVVTQEVRLAAYNGVLLNIKNIIAQIEPAKANRILLMAHWDTRPVADHDPDESKQNSPIPGANDGASGVGVLLEIARQLQITKPLLGVDIILFDAEDYGVPEQSSIEWQADTWCLGSQYWSNNPHKKNYYARYGILLDMVGAKNAVFTQEEVSRHFAPSVVDKVWKTARDLSYGQYFSYQKTPQIIDDHRYVNEIIGIPSIDIIQYDPTTDSNFGAYWHTHKDDISVIDKATLKAVGTVVLNVVLKEQ